MKCVECKNFEGDWLLFHSDKYLLICETCLQSYIQMEGEINLDFWYLKLGDWGTIFGDVNRRLEYWQHMYKKAYNGEFNKIPSSDESGDKNE